MIFIQCWHDISVCSCSTGCCVAEQAGSQTVWSRHTHVSRVVCTSSRSHLLWVQGRRDFRKKVRVSNCHNWRVWREYHSGVLLWSLLQIWWLLLCCWERCRDHADEDNCDRYLHTFTHYRLIVTLFIIHCSSYLHVTVDSLLCSSIAKQLLHSDHFIHFYRLFGAKI